MKEPKGCRAWRRSRRAGRPEAAMALEGRPPCRPTLAGRSPAPIRPTRLRWRAGKMGADGASPSKGFRRALPRRVRGDTGGTTSVSSDSRGAQPRLHPADKAALARWKSGRRRSIALQGISLGAAAAAAGSAVQAAALSQAASTTSTRTTATTTSASVWPAAPEGFPDGEPLPEPAAVPLR